MKLFSCFLITGWLLLSQASARIIAHWPYLKLFQESDLVALVELASVADSDEKLPGHGKPERFQARLARLRIGLLLKGHAGARTIDLLHFAYGGDLVEPNGAIFLDFSDAEKHQYLVFLKKGEKGLFRPVTGHYDAGLSVKKIVKDHFSPIDEVNDPRAQRLEAVPLPLEGALHLARAFLEKKKVDRSGYELESAILRPDGKGKRVWDLKWNERQEGKGEWLLVEVGLDGKATLRRGR